MSSFGSHKSMVCDSMIHDTLMGWLWIIAHPDTVICKDAQGYYMTQPSRLDNGLADPNRYGSKDARAI